MKASELRDLSVSDLNAKLIETVSELRDATRSLAAGELANPRVITVARRNVARLKTIMAEKQLEQKEKNNA